MNEDEEIMKCYFEDFYDYVVWHYNFNQDSWGYFRARWYWDERVGCSIEPVIYWGA